MGKLSSFFDFTTGQLRILAILALVCVTLSCYLFVRSYARPEPEALMLPVSFSSHETQVMGVFQLDPNTAPADSLELLPGIGTKLADRIVAHRQHSRFNQPIDITDVKGIGPKMFERLRPYLKVTPK